MHGFQSKQALIDDQIRAIQFYRLKQEQAMKQMEQKPRIKHYHHSEGRVFGEFDNGPKAAPNSNNPRYNLQQQQQQGNQQAGSHMRAVFLNASDSRNGSCGTGVYLPRGIGTPTESRKKQDACVSGRNSMYSLQKGPSKTVPSMNHQEMNLPQERTY